MLVFDHINLRQQMEKDGRGDVVGQIAHHANFAQGGRRGLGQHLSGQRPKVDLEHIRFDHRQLRVFAQAHGQVTVQLNHRQMTQPLHQRLRERRQTGADLHHGLTSHRGDGVHDGIDDAAVRQKVLAKAFAGNVLHWTGSRISTKARPRTSSAQAT